MGCDSPKAWALDCEPGRSAAQVTLAAAHYIKMTSDLPIMCVYLIEATERALLDRWTNGSYRSALHRVVTTSKVERYSTAFFVEPNYDSLVEPLPQCCSFENPAR